MPRPSHLNPDDILRFLQVSANPPAASDISRALHLKKSDQRPLFKMLAKLKKRGAIDELPGGRYRLAGRKNDPRHGHDAAPRQASRDDAYRSSGRPDHPSAAREIAHHRDTLARDEVRGRLVLHHDGYGFVVPDHPIPQLDGDIFIPRDAVEDAMHGDRVVAKLQRVSDSRGRDFRIAGSRGGQRAEGRIVRVLGRAHPSVVGLFRYGPRGNVVLSYDVRMQHQIEIPPGDELTAALREKLGLG